MTNTAPELTQPVGSVNLLDKLTEGRELPAGYAGWAIRTVWPDFTSQYGYRYPYPGKVAKAPGPIIRDNDHPCPGDVGDGICAAFNWTGMASGGAPARTLLLVAYREKDILGQSSEKLRAQKFKVVDLIDGERLIRVSGAYANLRGANLRGANLRGANLRGANLRGANLWGANLRGANLRGANLQGADLRGADLRGADLRGANLRGANLQGADLWGANLQGANLWGANLQGANLQGANLQGADLQGADLWGADLRGANLQGADLRGANLRGALNAPAGVAS